MRLLVTGATGFIGSCLVERLSKYNHQIYCLIRKNSDKNKVGNLRKLGCKLLIGDLKEIQKIDLPKKIDWIFHCAALVDTADVYPYEVLFRENVKATRDLADFYIGEIKKFIFLSSMGAMGVRDQKGLVTERTSCRPITKYGKTKLESEKYLLKLYKEKKFPVVILRAPTVYGPGEHYNFLKLSRAIYKGRFYLIGDGRNKMSLCFVDNLVEAMILAAKSKVTGEIFLIDDGQPKMLREVVREITKAENRKIPAYSIPYPLAYLSAIFFELMTKIAPFEPPLSRKRLITLTSNFAFDVSKAKKTLGYKPKVSFRKAIEETINSFKEEGLLK